MKPVAAKTPRLPDPRQSETVNHGIMARVEGGVEAQDLRQPRPRGAKGGRPRQRLGLVQGASGASAATAARTASVTSVAAQKRGPP